jgi:hypothetical protein
MFKSEPQGIQAFEVRLGNGRNDILQHSLYSCQVAIADSASKHLEHLSVHLASAHLVSVLERRI